jgi:hypothetical protein
VGAWGFRTGDRNQELPKGSSESMASKADSNSRRIDQWQKADTAVLLLNSVSCLPSSD